MCSSNSKVQGYFSAGTRCVRSSEDFVRTPSASLSLVVLFWHPCWARCPLWWQDGCQLISSQGPWWRGGENFFLSGSNQPAVGDGLGQDHIPVPEPVRVAVGMESFDWLGLDHRLILHRGKDVGKSFLPIMWSRTWGGENSPWRPGKNPHSF